MLYRYIIENYRSFRDNTEWSLIPTISKNHTHKGIQIQQVNAMYGANASGKSTLIKSLAYMREVIAKNNDVLRKKENQCYKMDPAYIDKPTLFNVQILCGDILYDYGFSYLYKTGQIIAEWLYALDEKSENEIFTRELKEEKYVVDIPKKYEFDDTNAIEVYKADMIKSYSKLLLSEFASKKNTAEIVKASKAVVDWFNKLIVIFPESKFNLIRNIREAEDEMNKLYTKHFERFGIDISRIKLETIPPKYLNIGSDMKEDILGELRDDRAEGVHSRIIITKDSTPILIELDDAGDLKAQEVVFVHEYKEGKGASMHWKDESDGTNRLFDIIPIADAIASAPTVVVIDELDRSLHSNLTKEFVRYIKEQLKGTQSQFLFTTHDTMLMDTSLIKRDEIWMVEKEEGASRLTPLAQYKLKNSEYIRENYLLGRYGGIAKI